MSDMDSAITFAHRVDVGMYLRFGKKSRGFLLIPSIDRHLHLFFPGCNLALDTKYWNLNFTEPNLFIIDESVPFDTVKETYRFLKSKRCNPTRTAFVTHYERALEEMYGEDTENSMCEDRLRIIGQIEQDIVFDDDDELCRVSVLEEKDRVVATKDVVSPSVIDEPVVNEKRSSLANTCIPNVEKTGLSSYPPLPTQGSTSVGNTPGMSSYANVTGEPTVSERFANTAYGFFLGKRVAYPVVANYVRNTWGKYGLVKLMLNSSTGLFSFQFSSMDGLNAMLENGPWFIRNHPLILKKWNLNLLKEDVGNVLVWVKLHGVPVTAFSEDGLSAIATKIGTPLMLDSYTFDMCLQSWGRSSYSRAMIELRANVKLKDTIVEECPKNPGLGVAKNLKKPRQAPRGVPVGSNVGFKPVKQAYRPVPTKPIANTSGKKKNDVEPTKKVSNSNPFDVLNSVENDVDLGTNGGSTNLFSKEPISSGSSFWNVESSSTSTTLIVDKIGKFEKLIIDGKVILVDDKGEPVRKVDYSRDHDSEDEVASVDNDMARFMASKKVGFGTNSLLEQWRDTYENDDYDYDPYDDDMNEGQEIPDKIQAICDNLDIKVRGRKKK
ncbi:retrotransposon protein, putative, ty1-copia subclass [Tanacetum coccineum]